MGKIPVGGGENGSIRMVDENNPLYDYLEQMGLIEKPKQPITVKAKNWFSRLIGRK